jgi:NitT/TauT family transport system substrate-binding protein
MTNKANQNSSHKLFLILLILICASCHQRRADSYKPLTITIATLNGPSVISMIGMMQDSILNDSVKLNFIIKNEPNQVKPLVLQGEADFAVLPTNMASILYNMGIDYQLAAIPVWGTLYLSGSDTSIHILADMKGKRVYLMARGMTPDIVFRYLLLRNGIKPDNDIVLDYSFPSHIDLGNAMVAGRAPLGVISEPMVSLAIDKNPFMRRLINIETEWNRVLADSIPFAQTGLLVRREFALKHPEAVASFLDRYRKSIQWLKNYPGEASMQLSKKGLLPDSSLARNAIAGCNIRYMEADSIKTGIISYLRVLYLYDPDITGGKLPDDNFFYAPGQ